MVGSNGGSTGVPGAKKIIVSKIVPKPFGMLKQVFLARFEPVVTRFGPWKIPKCLENGPFWDQKWAKKGSKTRFSKNDLGPFGMLKQVFLARFEPVVTRFGPWKIPKCLEKGPLWVQKWAKKGSEKHFSKSDPGPFGMLKQVFLAHFEPMATHFQPPPQFGEEIPTIRQNNSAGLFFGEMLPSHQDYGPGPPNTLSLWLLCCQRHVETLIS